MRKIFCYIISLLLSQHLSAQNHAIDSLQHAVDTARLDSLKIFSANALFNRVVQSGDIERSKKIIDSMLAWSQQMQYRKGFRLAYNNTGTWYYHQGKFANAIEFYQKSYEVSASIASPMGMESALNNTGLMYRQMGLYDKALDAYSKALKIEKENDAKSDFKNDEANTLINMAGVHKQMHNYNKALELTVEASKIHLRLKDTLGYAIDKLTEGGTHKALENPTKAMQCFQEALFLAKIVDYKQVQCDALNDIGDLYEEQKDYTNALSFYTRGFDIAQSIQATNAEIVALTSLGGIYIKLDDYSKAEQYLQHAYTLAKEEDDLDGQLDITRSLSSLYAKTKNYKKANEHLENYIALNDSIFSRDKQEAIEKIQTQLETAEKEKQIELLNAEKSLQDKELESSRLRNTFLIVAVILVVVASVFFIVYIRNRNKVKQLQQALQLRNKISADLHDDIGSSLSSIAMFSDVASVQLQHQAPQSVSLLETISTTAQNTMVNMSDIVWSINPDHDRFENIFSRMQHFASGMLETKNIQLHFSTSESLYDKKMPMQQRKDFYLLFKEAINNLAKYSDAANAWVQIKLEKNILHLSVQDDGNGFDTLVVNTGNGMRTMQKRAAALGGRLNIISGEEGTIIALQLPLP